MRCPGAGTIALAAKELKSRDTPHDELRRLFPLSPVLAEVKLDLKDPVVLQETSNARSFPQPGRQGIF